MELGHYQLQIIASVALILTAALVAIICDSLKRSNDRLREMNIELKIRQEEQQKLSYVATPRVAERPRAEMIPAPAVPVAPKERSIVNKPAVNNDKRRTVNAGALAAMERGAALASAGIRPRSSSAAPVPPEIARPEPASFRVRKDWGSLLTRNAQGAVQSAVKVAPAPTPTVLPAPVERVLPAGFQDGFVLNNLVLSRQPISGLVVSIGVNNASRKSDRKLPEAVLKLVESLIGPTDFAAQSSEDEFLLIYPQERGASAQRRLSKIAQQLWDFQLRSLGSLQILFSWGGVEVKSESIEEAIASASERMQETKRGRKLVAMEFPKPAGGRLRQVG